MALDRHCSLIDKKQRAGHAAALAIWVDVDLTYEAAAGHEEEAAACVVPGYGSRSARQMLRWLEGGGKEVGAGASWWVEISAALDLVHTPGVYTECRLVQDEGFGEEEEERA